MTILEPAVLDVTRLTDSRYRFHLSHPGAPFVGATQRHWDVHVHEQSLVELCSEIHAAVQRANTGLQDDSGVDALRRCGAGLFKELLPRLPDPRLEDLRRELRTLTTPLLIAADPSELPWELLLDAEDGDFLALRHDVARRLKTRASQAATVVESTELRCLMIADPNEGEAGWGLPQTAAEAAQLHEWLVEREVSCDLLQGADATHRAVINRLIGEPYDLIHYAGHIVEDVAGGEFAWRLRDGMTLTSSAIRNQLTGSPIVFLNGCWSAATAGSHLTDVEAMTDAMLEAGARMVVGSVYQVPDVGARLFAERFYDEILRGTPLGAAMRAARRELSCQPAYRASWACFVMYGDPCMVLAVGEAPGDPPDDPLGGVLRLVGIARKQLDAGAAAVLEQACEHGRPAGVLGTPHLFAAMVAGADTTLRDRLAARGAAPERLRELFQSAFETAGILGPADPETLEPTDNARAILEATAAAASERTITERTLLDAFVACAGGTTSHILGGLGIDIAELGGDQRQPPPARGPAGGEPASAGALALARAIAVNSGHEAVSSWHLFQALLAGSPSPLAGALRRVGCDDRFVTSLSPQPSVLRAPGPGSDVGMSHNAGEIVLMAQAAAAAEGRADATDADLFAAFVANGGGRTGTMLHEHGLPVAALGSAVFAERGLVDTSRFDECARAALEGAAALAAGKHHTALTRVHLLHGLLGADGSLAAALRAQDHEPSVLANRLLAELDGGPRHVRGEVLRLGAMTAGLIEVLCDADARRGEAQDHEISERHVVAALFADGGGSAGRFLARNNVMLDGLPA